MARGSRASSGCASCPRFPGRWGGWIHGPAGVWRPENYSAGKYRGPTTLRNALRWSLNTVTVRLAQDIGMPLIGEYAKRFGVYDELPNYLSYALGAGETTVMRMVTAYSMFANGGRRVKST